MVLTLATQIVREPVIAAILYGDGLRMYDAARGCMYNQQRPARMIGGQKHSSLPARAAWGKDQGTQRDWGEDLKRP